ncbi:MAG: hypothetical protein AAGC53_03365 [Actinomycetota bacterium]
MSSMQRSTIVIATCAMWPGVSESDQLLVDELTRRGHTVIDRPWNDAPVSDFTDADMIVLRSNWDFHHHLDAWNTWLDDVEAGDVRLVNDAELVRLHNTKAYLRHYQAAGLPTPTTLMTDTFDSEAVAAWMDDHGFDRIVCKPEWGASGHGVDLVTRDGIEAARQQWAAADEQRPLLFQEFMPEIRSGEYALVFFGETFSHAFRRKPTGGDFRVNTQYGGEVTLADLSNDAIDFGRRVVDALPSPAAYARIDIVPSGSGFALMEVEINEPSLAMSLDPASAARFADSLEGQ